MKIRCNIILQGAAMAIVCVALLTTFCFGQGTLDQENNPPWTGAATNIAPENQVSQIFTPTLPVLVGVEVALMTGNSGRGGDQVTLSILGATGVTMASSSANVPEGFDGFWRFDLPGGGLSVTPGQPFMIRLRDTGKIVFWWKYKNGNTYPAGQAYFYGSVFSDNDFYFKTYGSTAPLCSIPSFQPTYWNDCNNTSGTCIWQPWNGCGAVSTRYCSGCGSNCGLAQCKNNCYNYANNKRTDTFAQPGCASSGSAVSNMSCSAVQNAALADGLVAAAADGTCPGNMDKVALVVAPSSDFHWYRLGSDGMWTHKPGMTAATNLDQSSHTISNPETANRGPYTDFCGYLCTCSDAQQGQGHQNIQ